MTVNEINFQRPTNTKFQSKDRYLIPIHNEWEYSNGRLKWWEEDITTNKRIDCFMEPRESKQTLRFLDFISSLPINKEGGIAEVGVHLGWFFIAMNQLIDDNSDAMAIDLFQEGQKYNVSISGGCDPVSDWVPEEHEFTERDLEVMNDQLVWFNQNLHNLDLKNRGENVIIHQGDSMTMVPEDLGIRKYKYISVDGGHDPEHAENDLRLVERCITQEGVVILDDWFQPQFMGVTEGYFNYKSNGGSLVPFAVCGNKMYLCNYSVHYMYIQYLEQLKVRKSTDKISGYEVVLIY